MIAKSNFEHAVFVRSQYYNNTETRGFSVNFERWLDIITKLLVTEIRGFLS